MDKSTKKQFPKWTNQRKNSFRNGQIKIKKSPEMDKLTKRQFQNRQINKKKSVPNCANQR